MSSDLISLCHLDSQEMSAKNPMSTHSAPPLSGFLDLPTALFLVKVASRYAKVITMDCIISHRNLCQFEQIGNRKFGQIIPVHHLNRKTQMLARRSRPTQLFYLAQRVWLKMKRYVYVWFLQFMPICVCSKLMSKTVKFGHKSYQLSFVNLQVMSKYFK